MWHIIAKLPRFVHCRVGSLETGVGAGTGGSIGSLPRRQLRKSKTQPDLVHQRSLPRRQLRNSARYKCKRKGGSLPRRQLRKG